MKILESSQTLLHVLKRETVPWVAMRYSQVWSVCRTYRSAAAPFVRTTCTSSFQYGKGAGRGFCAEFVTCYLRSSNIQ